MNYITITDNTVKVIVDFGVYAASIKVPELMSVSKKAIIEVIKENDIIQVTTVTGKTYYLSSQDDSSNGVFKVDSVKGVAPSDNTHLCQLIYDLMG